MKKSARKKTKKTSKKPTLLDRLPKNKGEFLQLMIKMTERAIVNPESQGYLVNQSNRLKSELDKWNKENK